LDRSLVENRSLVELESIVRNRICGVCTERTVDAQCGLEKPSSCALFRLFPQVAQAIQSVQSDDIQQYIDAIRRNVCSVCVDLASDESCETRQQVRCSLDAYLLLVVDAIEEAPGKTFNKRGLDAATRRCDGPAGGGVVGQPVVAIQPLKNPWR
jgi:hypothetical protein